MGSEIAPNCCLTLPFAALRIPQKIDDLPRCEHILEALCILCGLVKLVYACRPHLSAVGNPNFAALVRDLRHGVSGTGYGGVQAVDGLTCWHRDNLLPAGYSADSMFVQTERPSQVEPTRISNITARTSSWRSVCTNME